MQWKPEYETGISEIDSQHRAIIQMVTEVEAAVGADMGWNSLSHLVTRAKEYSKFHFSVEESLMQVFKYPRLCAHRGEHRYILRRVEDIEGRVLRTNGREGLLQGFRTWVLGHFLESDRHFAEFMRNAVPAGMGEAAPVDAATAPHGTNMCERSMRRAMHQTPSINTSIRET